MRVHGVGWRVLAVAALALSVAMPPGASAGDRSVMNIGKVESGIGASDQSPEIVNVSHDALVVATPLFVLTAASVPDHGIGRLAFAVDGGGMRLMPGRLASNLTLSRGEGSAVYSGARRAIEPFIRQSVQVAGFVGSRYAAQDFGSPGSFAEHRPSKIIFSSSALMRGG